MSSKTISYTDMSLEDIIQRKKKETRTKNNGSNISKNRPQQSKQKPPIVDARLKIISKKRVQITDAREKLAELAKQKDARLKIEQMRLKRLGGLGGGGHLKPRNMKFRNVNKFARTIQTKERVFVDTSRQVVSQPLTNSRNYVRQIHSNRLIGNNYKSKRSPSDNTSRPKPILRTVENDIEIIDDPMGEDFESPTTSVLNRRDLHLQIVAHKNDALPRSISSQRFTNSVKERSPPRPPSILKKRPMAALRTDKPIEIVDEKPTLEYRIIVSNLRNTVTAGDIDELFGDVGGMVESRLVRSGTAEVIYKTQEDAQKAVDLYHNRQLDGQPMNCLLVTPRANPVAARSSTKPGLYSTSSNVVPDISAFHKILFEHK